MNFTLTRLPTFQTPHAAAITAAAAGMIFLLSAMPAGAYDGDTGNYEAPEADEEGYYWWKGNLHTHTLWSDGDHYPEVIADWYKRNGYHFLALSDHNVISRGTKWIHPIEHRFTRGKGEEALELYRERFGEDWVETRVVDEEFRAELERIPEGGGSGARRPPEEHMKLGEELVRLKPLNEFRTFFEEPNRFLMLKAEEITDYIHVNVTNLVDFIPPQGGDGARETIEKNIEAVMQQRDETGQPMLPHLNHPNWRWRVTAEDMAPVEDLRFFEVYNGHRNSRNYGDDTHKSLERMWDIILAQRLGEKGLDVIYGLAVDDSHNYEDSSSDVSRPGRGWVQVRSKFLTPEYLIDALESGDFYSSSGVTLRRIRVNDDNISIEIDAEDGVTYTTEFIGTRRGFDPDSEAILDEDGGELGVTRKYSDDIGVVLDTVEGTTAAYSFEGDELYVRARVISSKDKENYYSEGEKEKAWVQPVVPDTE